MENVGIAVVISPLTCLQAEISVHPVLRPPSWIFSFRLHPTVSPLFPFFGGVRKWGVAVGISFLHGIQAEIHTFLSNALAEICYFWFDGRHIGFPGGVRVIQRTPFYSQNIFRKSH